MESAKSATISGFNEYIENLLKDRKNTYKVSLTLFNDKVEEKYINQSLPKVIELTERTYQPDGMTALYDAACRTLNKVRGNKGKNIVVILTDGEENSSKEFGSEDFKKLVKELQAKKNWTFVYLGANHDAWLIAKVWGFSEGNVSNYFQTSDGVGQAFSAVSNATMRFAANVGGGGGGGTAKFFSDEEKTKMENKT